MAQRLGALAIARPKKRRQPVSLGGKSYDPRPVVAPPRAPAPARPNWQALLNHQRQSGQPINFAALQAAGYKGPVPTGRGSAAGGAASAGSPGASAAAAGGGQLTDDAQAAAARAQAIFERTQQINALNEQGSYDRGDLDEALRRMAIERPKVEQGTRQSANKAGLLYSGQLGKQLGEVATEYSRRESDARSAYSRREAERQSQRDALDQQGQLTEQAISAALADRLAQHDADAAAAGALAAPSGGTPAAKSKPRNVSYDQLAKLGMRVEIRGDKIVVLDRGGNVIPGAVPGVAGKKRYVRLPGGV